MNQVEPPVLNAIQQFNTIDHRFRLHHARGRGETPIRGTFFEDRTDRWRSMEKVSSPKIAVVQDLDEPVGIGSVAGEVHAAIMRQLGCVGLGMSTSAAEARSRLMDCKA